MKVFAIGDLHLSVNNPKPMNVFGQNWDGYEQKIFDDWKSRVSGEDLVLLPGDFSWAMKLEDALMDAKLIENLPGKKILIRGNHDYWWSTISAVRKALPKDIYAVQNDAIKFGKYIICGTRGWTVPDGDKFASSEDEKIFKREVIRLEMTLQSAKKLQTDGETIICMMHYPPFSLRNDKSQFTELFDKFEIKTVVFGHLHAFSKFENKFVKGSTTYYMVSCDLCEFKLVALDV